MSVIPRDTRTLSGTATFLWTVRRRRGTIVVVADAIFEDPRLARVYDPLNADRSDLHVYVKLVEDLGARAALDIGCGTGTFACALARRGST